MPSKYLILKPDELIKILKQYNFDFISQKVAEIDIDEFRKYL